MFLAGLMLAMPSWLNAAGSPQAAVAALVAAFPETDTEFRATSEDQPDDAIVAVEAAFRDARERIQAIPFPEAGRRANDLLAALEHLIVARGHLERRLDTVLASRHRLDAVRQADEGQTPGDQPMATVAGYLRATHRLIELSGRVHEHVRASVNHVTLGLAGFPRERERMVALMQRLGSREGATILAYALVDPPAETFNNAQPASLTTKRAILQLIRHTRQVDALPMLADALFEGELPPSLSLDVAQTILAVGLPQEPAAEQSSTLRDPPLLPSELSEQLRRLPTQALSPTERVDRDRLLRQLTQIQNEGLPARSLRVGRHEIRPGDWLLIRNPSPYNLFTNLSPGLFTHVGIVAEQFDARGRRRLVVVEILEQGTRILASNVDAYLQVTLNYVFLRHRDPRVARKMAERAAEAIGRPCRFDLAFQLDGVERLKNHPLADVKIETYCAGILLLAAQETGLARERFFPLPEVPRNQLVIENLHRMGMAVGSTLVTPTGPLFAQDMELVGRRETLFDPSREIEQAVFDHFAGRIIERTVHPRANLYQNLRQRLAEMSRDNPRLAEVLAQLNNVDAETDLAAASRAAAVVEALDEVAYGQSAWYRATTEAFRAGPRDWMTQQGLDSAQIRAIERRRDSQSELWEAWQARQLSPLQLQDALIERAISIGREQVDGRFFRASEPTD